MVPFNLWTTLTSIFGLPQERPLWVAREMRVPAVLLVIWVIRATVITGSAFSEEQQL
jgi:hypothetical protein